MNEKERVQVALFKHGLISPILSGCVNQRDYLELIGSKSHHVPYYGERQYSPKTIMEWVRLYRQNGFDALKPKTRMDQGQQRKLSPDEMDVILYKRAQMTAMPIKVFYEQLIKQGDIPFKSISYCTLVRLLKKHDLSKKRAESEPERKRFAHDKVNTLWQGDLSHGPYVPVNGKPKKTFLIAYIDDCSRLVPFGQFFTSERFDGLRIVTKEALIRRGKPTIIYVDNGKIYRSDVLQYACAKLDIALINTRPYDPKAKGKIERFFLTVQTRFYPLLQVCPARSLEELNERFWEWLETDYHRRIHASLDGKTPHQVFHQQLQHVRFLNDSSLLDTIFLRREKRRVKADGTFSLDNKLYEVPPEFIGKPVDVRLDASGVYLFEQDLRIAEAKLVQFHDNAHVKRKRSLFEINAPSLEVETHV